MITGYGARCPRPEHGCPVGTHASCILKLRFAHHSRASRDLTRRRVEVAKHTFCAEWGALATSRRVRMLHLQRRDVPWTGLFHEACAWHLAPRSWRRQGLVCAAPWRSRLRTAKPHSPVSRGRSNARATIACGASAPRAPSARNRQGRQKERGGPSLSARRVFIHSPARTVDMPPGGAPGYPVSRGGGRGRAALVSARHPARLSGAAPLCCGQGTCAERFVKMQAPDGRSTRPMR